MPRFIRHGPARAAVAVLTLGLTIVVVTVAAQAAQPPGWHIGDPMETRIAVPTAVADAATAKAKGLLVAAGVQANGFQTTRIFNAYDSATEDLTVAVDPHGRALATYTEDVDTGQLRSLVRFDHPGASLAGDSSTMPAQAAAWLERVSLTAPTSRPEVSWDDGMGAWSVRWERMLDGAPVPTDALTVWVTPGATLRAISSRTTPASTGSRSLDEAGAIEKARIFMTGNVIARQAVFGDAKLEWRQANNFLDPSASDAPAPVLRLVYSVSYSIDLKSGLHTEGVLWVDAETGALIGGSDVG